MIAIMWQFDVKKGREAEFGSFLRDQNHSARYIVIEYRSEMVVYERHRAYRSDAIASLDGRRTALVESVEPLGIFAALDVPDRAGPTWSQRDGS
jgi:hypothetical protein